MLKNVTVTDIKNVFVVSAKKGERTKIENRACYGLSFCTEGQITYIHHGKKTVSDRHCAVILPEGQTYELTNDKSGSFPVINFTCADFLCDTVTSIPLSKSSACLADFNRLAELSLFEGNRAEMMSVLYHIFHLLSCENSSCGTIMPAINYIEENYHKNNITNAYLASLCNISEIYFRSLFKKHQNTTPHRFINEIRIKKAEQLLAEGQMKIYDVAEKCGFSSQYHFSRIFKEKNGLTPSEYMHLNRHRKI